MDTDPTSYIFIFVKLPSKPKKIPAENTKFQVVPPYKLLAPHKVSLFTKLKKIMATHFTIFSPPNIRPS
jgi:hypothetical protein